MEKRNITPCLTFPVKSSTKNAVRLFLYNDHIIRQFYYTHLKGIELTDRDVRMLTICYEYRDLSGLIQCRLFHTLIGFISSFRKPSDLLNPLITAGYLVKPDSSHYSLTLEGIKLVLVWYEFIEYILNEKDSIFFR